MDKIQPEEYLRDELRVFVVPVEIFDVPGLTCHEQMVYMVLRSHCSAREMTAFPSYATIAREGRMSRRQAIRAVETLVERGLLGKQQQFTVTKNKEIKNTSNLYTVKNVRQVVTVSHYPSDSQSLPLVTDSHHPSDSQSPRTKSFEHNHLEHNQTTTETDTVGVVVEECLGKRIKLSDLKKWIEQYGKEYVIAKAQYIGATRNQYTKSIIGAFRKAIEEDWDTGAFAEIAATTETMQVRDERYTAFYNLFPNY